LNVAAALLPDCIGSARVQIARLIANENCRRIVGAPKPQAPKVEKTRRGGFLWEKAPR
jgi:hypothetical protein